jgi:anti-anti-sigma regulatory factor
MNITITSLTPGHVSTAILRPAGVLDWSNYHDLIMQAQAARSKGVRHLIVDMSDIERVSIAGLVGLHVVARLAQDAAPPDEESGWEALRALAEDNRPLQQLAIVNPRPSVYQTLARAPFSGFLTIHANLDTALAALDRPGAIIER